MDFFYLIIAVLHLFVTTSHNSLQKNDLKKRQEKYN